VACFRDEVGEDLEQ